MNRFLIVCLLLSSVVFSQNNSGDQDLTQREKMIKEFMQSRKKMMEQMMQAFGEDDFFEDDMDDDFFKGILGNRFKNLKKMGSPLVNIERVQKRNGEIDIYLKPKDKTVEMDLDTTKNAIIIKAKQVSKVENQNKTGIQTSMSQSQFSQQIAIPFGYKATPAKAVEGRVLITLKPSNKKINPNGRVPIQKRKNEETI